MTTLSVKVNGGAAINAISASFQPRTLNQGHKLFSVIVDNVANEYGGDFAINDEVEILINDVSVFKGIIDSISHQPEYRQKWNWMDYLRISGREAGGFELSGYKITKSWASDLEIHEIMDDALTVTGCPLALASGITSTATVGGHSAQDTYLIDLFRELLAKANYYGDVETDGDIHLYAMDSEDLETGPTLTDILGISKLIEADGLEIRNKITVLGAAILDDPADQDAHTEAVTDWTSDGSLAAVSASKVVGSYSVLASKADSSIYSELAKSFSLIYDQRNTLKFSFQFQETDDIGPATVKVQLRTTSSDYFETEITDLITPAAWNFVDLPLGWGAELTDANQDGIWTKTGAPDWLAITAIRFIVEGTGSAIDLYVDGLFLTPARPRGFAEDGASQAAYGVRELTLIKDDLTTEAEAQAEAESQLEKLKDPAENIPHIIARGDDFMSGGVFLAEPGRFVTLDTDIISGKFRMENLTVNVAPRQNINNGYDFTVEFDGVPETAKVDADRLNKITKGGMLSVIKGLARVLTRK